MFKYLTFICVVILCIDISVCGTFGRSGGTTGSNYGSVKSDYYSSGGSKRSGLMSGSPVEENIQLNPKNPSHLSSSRSASGISAWGIIFVIMFVILVGFGGYYGIICYPLICKQDRNYDIMDGSSTTTTTSTPTRSGEFEKIDSEYDGSVFRFK